MDLRYPIGKFKFQWLVTDEKRQSLIDDIEAAPGELREAVAGLTPVQLDTPYRADGWTVRQVVHHVPDSHINSYVRFRLALTEVTPTITPYQEAQWAELADARTGHIEMSLLLLEALHQRWVPLLRNLTPEDCARSFKHPEIGDVTLDQNIGIYAWHGRHHVAHITALRERMGW